MPAAGPSFFRSQPWPSWVAWWCGLSPCSSAADRVPGRARADAGTGRSDPAPDSVSRGRAPPPRGWSALGARHGDRAVEAGPIFDVELADLDIALKAARATQAKALLSDHFALDVAADLDVAALQAGLHDGRCLDDDVTRGDDLPFDRPVNHQIAADDQLALEAIIGSQGDRAARVLAGPRAVGFHRRGALLGLWASAHLVCRLLHG